MFTSIVKKLNQKNTLTVLLGLLVLVIVVPNVAYADLLEVFLWKLVNGVFGWLVWVSGMLLDYAINSMVVDFGKMYATQGIGQTIDNLWVTVRDIFNLTFIFGLVFIGLRMIFGSDSNTKKMLVSIILAALLVNFSLFITKFVVDFSNIAAVQLVNAFPKDVNTGIPSVSGTFMNLMGVVSIWNFVTSAGADFSTMSGGGSIGYILGSMFLYIITAFVFFAGALILIIRFVVLNIYMVLSPFMFIGWVFPSMAKYSSEYWSGFLSRCFVAPAYLLMLYFSSKVLVSFSVTGGGGANSLSTMWTKAAPASFAQVFPPFILTAVFLIASIVVAQKMGAQGASSMISMGNKMVGKAKGYGKRAAGGATAGTTAFVGRQTVGRVGNKLANNQSFINWTAKRGAAGRTLLRATQGAANSSFDARNIAGVGKAYGLGGGNDKGYTARKAAADKKKKEREIKFGNSLGVTDIKTSEGQEAVKKTKENIVLAERNKKEGSDLQKAEASLATNTTAVTSTVAAVNAKEAEIATQKTAKEAEVTKLEAELKDAKKYRTKDESDEVEKKLNATKAELGDIEKNSGLTDLKNDVAIAQKDFANSQKVLEAVMAGLQTKAESATIYANQIEYAKTIQGKADFWNKFSIVRKVLPGGRNERVAKEMKEYYGEYGETAQKNIAQTEKDNKDSLDRDKLMKDWLKYQREQKEKEGAGATPTPPPPPPNPTT